MVAPREIGRGSRVAFEVRAGLRRWDRTTPEWPVNHSPGPKPPIRPSKTSADDYTELTAQDTS